MAVVPRDAQSAGFSELGTCRQTADGNRDWISDTRLATNVFQRFGTDCSQASTTAESVQQWIVIPLILIDFFTNSSARTSKTAPQSSNWGTLRTLSGATLVLEYMRDIWTCFENDFIHK